MVIELNYIRGIQGGIHHLLMPRLQWGMLTPQFQYLKKHVPLQQCSAIGLTALKNAVGHTLAFVDGGYILSLVALPTSFTNPDHRLKDQFLYRVMAAELLNSLFISFKGKLQNLSKKDMSRPTLQKQGTASTASFRVLRMDLTFILSILDKAHKKPWLSSG